MRIILFRRRPAASDARNCRHKIFDHFKWIFIIIFLTLKSELHVRVEYHFAQININVYVLFKIYNKIVINNNQLKSNEIVEKQYVFGKIVPFANNNRNESYLLLLITIFLFFFF